jgi:hypothetical protein
MEMLLAVALLALLAAASWRYGVDSRDWGLDLRTGRSRRWL